MRGECPLTGLFWDAFSSKLNLPGRMTLSLILSLVGELFLLPSLGDLALVGGI